MLCSIKHFLERTLSVCHVFKKCWLFVGSWDGLMTDPDPTFNVDTDLDLLTVVRNIFFL